MSYNQSKLKKGLKLMQWENLTAPDFARLVQETGTCIIAFGVVERHSDHLPLGTDFLNGHRIASLAAEHEPAVVFPPFYFGQIYEARCFPGTLTLKPTLLIELIQSLFDEIGRNGFKKIILYNAHGGNNNLLPFLAQSTLYEQKPYSLYIYRGAYTEAERREREAILESKLHGHACECETSTTLANFPELVKMERVPVEPGNPLGRMQLKGNYSGIWWYGDYPEHYAGDARTASAEKGRRLVELESRVLARFIQAVKADQVVAELENEFFEREKRLRD
jgi:creatinine amidohydrolase